MGPEQFPVRRTSGTHASSERAERLVAPEEGITARLSAIPACACQEHGFYIDGKWVNPKGRKRFETINPATGRCSARSPWAPPDDLAAAVKAAKNASSIGGPPGGWGQPRLPSGEEREELQDPPVEHLHGLTFSLAPWVLRGSYHALGPEW